MYIKTHCRDTLKSLRAPKAAVFSLRGDVLRKIAAAQKKARGISPNGGPGLPSDSHNDVLFRRQQINV